MTPNRQEHEMRKQSPTVIRIKLIRQRVSAKHLNDLDVEELRSVQFVLTAKHPSLDRSRGRRSQ